MDEARESRRETARELSRWRVDGRPDRGWTEKRIEHERSRESGRVTTLEVDEAESHMASDGLDTLTQDKNTCALYIRIIL